MDNRWKTKPDAKEVMENIEQLEQQLRMLRINTNHEFDNLIKELNNLKIEAQQNTTPMQSIEYRVQVLAQKLKTMAVKEDTPINEYGSYLNRKE